MEDEVEKQERESELYLSLECSISARETVLVELTEDGARFDFQLCARGICFQICLTC